MLRKSCRRSACLPPCWSATAWDVGSSSKPPCRHQPRRAGVVLIDGSQFAPAMEAVLKQTFATPNGFEALIRRWFEEMFTAKSNAAVVASVVERAERLPRSIGEKLLIDMLRYDVGRLTTSLADLRVPVMAIQTTYSNEQRERRPMSKGQTTPYLDMLRARIPSVRIEIIEDTGHFPQFDESRADECAARQFPRHAVGKLVRQRILARHAFAETNSGEANRIARLLS